MRRTLKQRQVKTAPPTTPAASPRLPHERDESADSQAMGAPREDMQQAFDDLERGLVDTDLRGATPGTAEANRARSSPADATNEGRTRDPNTQKLPDGNVKKDAER
ncbi:hypothetical protein [Janthinobacterium sp. 17J80-10]|uniref:hypothetical protein n=1 Tax=Janthinobacterium sp. 17J80-10 TaxID=2497863 RepID=UPI0019D70F47|nr:hypothetical protein [Janthinobacterium sp. 17J80-10]